MSDENKAQLSMLTDIYREVGETKVTVENVSKKLDSHVEYTGSELRRINELDLEQNKILDAHVAGVNTLRDMHVAHRIETIEQIDLLKQSLALQKKECDARIEIIERPINWAKDTLKYAGKAIIWVGSIAGAVAAILALFGGI